MMKIKPMNQCIHSQFCVWKEYLHMQILMNNTDRPSAQKSIIGLLEKKKKFLG